MILRAATSRRIAAQSERRSSTWSARRRSGWRRVRPGLARVTTKIMSHAQAEVWQDRSSISRPGGGFLSAARPHRAGGEQGGLRAHGIVG